MWHTYILHRPCCPPILALALLWGCDNHVTVCRCQQETGRDDAVHHWQPAATSSLHHHILVVGIHCLVALFGWLGALNYSCLGRRRNSALLRSPAAGAVMMSVISLQSEKCQALVYNLITQPPHEG